MPLAQSYEQARDQVEQLVERFDRNLDLYKRPGYKEARVRVEFIDPFFEALGWDVRNVQGRGEHDKDVVHEDVVSIGGKPRAPDYSFRIGQKRQFFVEAKKPAVALKSDVAPALQLRRYSWTAKLPLGLLTDFEEFAVYDCRFRPAQTDKVSVGCVEYITFDSYLDRFDEIYELFAKSCVQQGSLDQYAQEKARRGTSEVDAELLKEIDGWREQLARNIALRNLGLSVHELNDAVQRTIDRIIFLRMAEDRGIEEYKRLLRLTDGPQIYARMAETLYRQADDKYNSGLFDFEADTLTTTLQIDDRVLKPILTSLYYPQSPYEFSVLPVEILGQVYEQFLGKVIRLTPAHRAKVEEKPEVKKAGGVYYTPSYIVDYIVGQTVGKLVEGKSPRQLRGRVGAHGRAPLRILDPACGSGSFLLGAYQYLLDHYLHWYEENDPQRQARSKEPAVYQGAGGAWFLTTAERKRILLDHIYGVDIDRQAVEVTKLSLLLKVLEGETQETLGQQLSLWRERALPDLKDNIKCGNSLIGPEYFEGQLIPEDGEYRRVNPFDWEHQFPEAMAAGGFDAVIGNPPYGFHQVHSESVKPYFKKHFVASHGSFEHYFLFYERSIKLLSKGGIHGFIVPVTWLTIPSARSLRKLIVEEYWIREICWLPELVFVNAQVNTLISVIQNLPAAATRVRIYDVLGFQAPPKEERTYEQSQFIDADYYIGIFEKDTDTDILQRMTSLSAPLKTMARPCSGYNPYERGKGEAPRGGAQTKETVEKKPYHSDRRLSDEWKPEIVGRNLGRYSIDVTGQRWIKYGPWLAAPRDPENFLGKRILVQEITGGKDRRIVATYYDGELYHSRDVIPIKIERETPHPFYLLGIINSRLLTWYHHKRNPKAKKGLFPKVLVSDLKKMPIHPVNPESPADVGRHDRMVALVERMLELHKKMAAATIAADKELYQRQIEATDRQIDALVYELYGLTEEEIAIVEGSGT